MIVSSGECEQELEGDSGMTAGRTVNSQSVNWCTPPKYVDAVRTVFNDKIALDPCSNEWSIVNAETEYRLPDQDIQVRVCSQALWIRSSRLGSSRNKHKALEGVRVGSGNRCLLPLRYTTPVFG